MSIRKERAAVWLARHCDWIQCPVCGLAMKVAGKDNMYCKNHHHFDLSKFGYINLLNSRTATRYDKELFQARRNMIHAGFFDSLIQNLAVKLAAPSVRTAGSATSAYQALRILDAGCGEGSILHSLGQLMTDNSPIEKDRLSFSPFDLKARTAGAQGMMNFTAAGIDIAKEGIRLAPKDNVAIAWFVADLAKMPFVDNLFDYVINVLSPAHYSEFLRVLRPGGTAIKVVPGKRYLGEIRELLAVKLKHHAPKTVYHYDDTIKRFREHFAQDVGEEKISYSFKVDESCFADIMRMSPLTWDGKGEQLLTTLRAGDLTEVTVDLIVLSGRKINSLQE